MKRIRYRIPSHRDFERTREGLKEVTKEEWEERIRRTIEGMDRTIARGMNVSPEVPEDEPATAPVSKPANS